MSLKKLFLLFICIFMVSCGIHVENGSSNCTLTFIYVEDENTELIINEYSEKYTYTYSFEKSHVITNSEYDDIYHRLNMTIPHNVGGYYTFSGFYSDLNKSTENKFCPGFIVNQNYTFYYSFTGGPYLVNLTIIDEGNHIFDKPTENRFTPYTKLTFHSYALYDADLYMKVNGIISYNHKTIYRDNAVIWEYELTITIEDTVVEFIVMTNDNYFFLNSIIDISLDDLIEGKIETQFIGVAPGNLTDIYYSKDKDDLFNLFQLLSYPLIPIDEKQTQITGGGSLTITYISANKQYEIYFNNRNIKIEDNYYHLNAKEPAFNKSYLHCHSFITYSNSYTIYSIEGNNNFQNLITTKTNLNEIEFVETSIDEITIENNSTYYCQTEFCEFKILSSKLFSITRDSNDIYYTIVGTVDFSFLY